MTPPYEWRAWDAELKAMIESEQFNDLLNGKEVAYSAPKIHKIPKKTTSLHFVDTMTGASGTKTHVDEWEDVTEVVRMKSWKGNPFAMRDLIVMQWIARFDKHGVKIFSGSIVRYEDGDIRVVAWNERLARFDTGELSYESPLFIEQDMVEVIGDKYRQPELLEKIA